MIQQLKNETTPNHFKPQINLDNILEWSFSTQQQPALSQGSSGLACDAVSSGG